MQAQPKSERPVADKRTFLARNPKVAVPARPLNRNVKLMACAGKQTRKPVTKVPTIDKKLATMTLEQLLAYHDTLLEEESKQVTEPMQISEERWKEADALVTESVKLECKLAPFE